MKSKYVTYNVHGRAFNIPYTKGNLIEAVKYMWVNGGVIYQCTGELLWKSPIAIFFDVPDKINFSSYNIYCICNECQRQTDVGITGSFIE